MKTIALLAMGVAATVYAQAQGLDSQLIQQTAPDTEPYRDSWGTIALKERGPNHKQFERTVIETDPQGNPVAWKRPAYTEIVSGMHYWDGEWKESREIIEPFQNGAVARQGQHKVIFAPNLNTAGAIDLEMPDGKRLRSHILGLSYYDEASDKSYLIAEVKDCQGEIVNGNQVIYRDAFKSIHADVRYTYTKGGFEQDVILLEQPPLPETFGLSTATTRLQVFTEFLNPPPPKKGATALKGKNNSVLRDESLDFGSMLMGRGTAFLLDSGTSEQTVPVGKQWRRIEGRDFLIEEVHIRSVTTELDQLPARQQEKQGASMPAKQRMAQAGQVVPPRLAVARSTKPMQMAMASLPPKAFVMDYVTLVNVSNYTFYGDTTYYVSGTVNLSGTNTIEGGAVVKFANSASAKLTLNGPLICDTEPYRPVVFTVKDDNSVGETISGSTGSPSTYSAVTFLNENSGTDNIYKYLRFTYAGTAIAGSTFSNGLWHCQFYRCGTNISVSGTSGKVALHNVLAARSGVVLRGQCSAYGEHLTVDQCGYLAFTDVTACAVTNSVLTAVTNSGSISAVTTCQLSSNAGVYQPAAWGLYYLVSGSTNRSVGTTNISVTLLADLGRMTTYPPVVYSNTTWTTAMVLSNQAPRDVDIPDLGYHYAPLDYVVAQVEAQQNVSATAGTVIAWFRSTSGFYHTGFGVHLWDNRTLTLDGQLTNPVWLVRCNIVQESDPTGFRQGIGAFDGQGTSWATAPVFTSRFARFSHMANDIYFSRDDSGYTYFKAQDCWFYNGGMGSYRCQNDITNCFFKGSNPGCVQYGRMNFYNNTMRRGSLYSASLYQSGDWPFKIINNAFDGTTFTFLAPSWGDTNVQYYNYNAYLSGGARLSPYGSNDVIVSNYNWQPGPLGTSYLPTNSALLNVGSTNANLLGLYHYTATTNQVKETNSTVDIGYHYVALNGGGQPVDTEGDGVPDYLEDANGNGDENDDSTSWKSYNSANGLMGASALQVFTPLKQ